MFVFNIALFHEATIVAEFAQRGSIVWNMFPYKGSFLSFDPRYMRTAT
jgi:hypothetical protein